MKIETNTYSQIRNDFYKKFHSKCVPILKNLDKERKNAILIALTVIISLILLFLVMCWLIIFNTKTASFEISEIQLFVVGVIMVSPGIGLSIYAKHFENKVKKLILPQLCKCFPDLKWQENYTVNHSLFKSAGIITKDYNRIFVDDVFTGSFKDVPFEIVEVKYQDERTTSSDGSTSTSVYTIFNGIIITLAMNKKFSSHTIVKPDLLLKISGLENLKHTTLEDVVFEKKYDVYTDNEVEARYLLTTSFMERLTNIKTIYKTSKIGCAFYKNKFIISMDVRRDMFKVGSLFKKTDNEKQYFQMYEEIISIIKLIDYFKLDQKLGL